MKYILQKDTNYYFRRKIPNTDINFTFSLNTKNVRIGKTIVSIFLDKSRSLFNILKYEEKEEIMSNYEKIRDLLLDYKDKARVEYSELEEQRHKHFTCVSKKGKIRDTSHPKCAKEWLNTILDIISDQDNSNELEYFEEIFKRTKIDKSLYDSLDEKEKKKIQFKTLKAETEVLVNDYKISKMRFNPEFSLKYNQPTQETITEVLKVENTQPNKYYEKTIQNLINEFVRLKEQDTKEIHRYTDPLNIFLQVVKKEFLIDVNTQDIQDFIFVMKNLPPQTSKENKDLYIQYKGNLKDLANHIYKNKLKSISLGNALEKIKKVENFIEYCLTEERVEKNRLNNKFLLPSNKEKKIRNRQEKKDPLPFTDNELNVLFNETDWYKNKIDDILQKKEFDKIFIPLIAVLQGARLNEISQLFISDIIIVDDIFCFNFDEENENQQIKNNSSIRVVPIHPKLIELHFLDYVELLKSNGETRVFPQLYYTSGKGYGQAFSKKFNNPNFKSSFIPLEKLENPKTKIDFHSFRHSFSQRAKGRINPIFVNDLLGHTGTSQNQRGGAYDHDVIPLLFEELQLLDISNIEFDNIQDKLDGYFEKIN